MTAFAAPTGVTQTAPSETARSGQLATEPALSEPFATRLRAQAQQAHTRAESAGFMSSLMAGTGSVGHYVRLLEQYYFIYDALERVGESFRGDPIGRAFISDALLRSDAIASDLSYFSGERWRDTVEPLAATVAYVARLEEVAVASTSAATSPSALYVAHHYLRYLGDLSGGQIIRVMVRRHYGIADEGLNFLVFPEVPKPKPFKDAYRAALDTAAWSAHDRNAFIDEVDRAYGLNFDLFSQLGERQS